MSNFSPKLEEATDEQLKHWINEFDFRVVPLASDELTRRSLGGLKETIQIFNQQSSKLVERQITAIKKQTEEIKSFNHSSKKSNQAMLLFTAILFFVGFIQLVVTILTSNVGTNFKIVLSLSSMAIIVYVMWSLDKEINKSTPKRNEKHKNHF